MASKSKTNDKAIQVGLETLSDAKPPKDRQFVTALARGLEVLRCFRAENPILGNQEIAQKTGLPKPTVSRLTFTLTELGYLRYSKNLRKYQLGTAVLALGYWPDETIGKSAPDIETHKWGLIVADPESQATSREGVWAGGDAVTGPDLVVTAMRAGRQAAESIDFYLKEKRGAEVT